jgi:branched-chain amino acid transport system permease protein
VTRGARERLALWATFVAVLIVAPMVFSKGFALTLLCQMGIVMIFALSYNMLLGQTGLLSFGHAVYYGLGAIITIHALNLGHGRLPVALMPLVGGIAGLFFGAVLGYVTTRRAGTTFAMISLGVGEMVAACSLMFPAFFGGEAGVSGNRSTGSAFLGITFGPQIQMYYLVAAWVLLCTAGTHALSRTPLGRMANAVRDNPERAQFVGYDPQTVRFLMVALSGFFAGVAGGLAALNYEIVSAESLSTRTSGLVLLATYLGGMGYFAGPILGAIVVTLMQTLLSTVTKAWPFYFGAVFLATVLFVPGGIASVMMLHKRLWDAKLLGRASVVYAAMAVPALLAFGAVVAMVEMAYRASGDIEGPLRVFGREFDAHAAGPWIAAAIVLALAGLACRWTWRRMAARRDAIAQQLASGRPP